MFLMVLASDHVSPATGLSPTVTLSKSGGSFASPAGAVTEVANGWYKVAGNATDTGTLGPLVLHATGTGADPTDIEFTVVAFDPQIATNLGLSALPTVTAGGAGGLVISGANSGAITFNSLTITNGFTVSGVSTFTGAVTANHASNDITGVETVVTDKTGFKLASDGLVEVTAWTVNITGNLTGSVGSVTGAVGSISGLTAADLQNMATRFLTMIVLDGAVYQYTTNALELGPAGGAAPTAAENAAALLDLADGIEIGLTPRGAFRLMSAALAGKVSGAGTGTETFRNAIADGKNRIVATVDSSGNRTAITADPT